MIVRSKLQKKSAEKSEGFKIDEFLFTFEMRWQCFYFGNIGKNKRFNTKLEQCLASSPCFDIYINHP